MNGELVAVHTCKRKRGVGVNAGWFIRCLFERTPVSCLCCRSYFFFSPTLYSCISTHLLSNIVLRAVFKEKALLPASGAPLNGCLGVWEDVFPYTLHSVFADKSKHRALFTGARMGLRSPLWKDWSHWFILDQAGMKETRKTSLHPSGRRFFYLFLFCHTGARLESTSHAGKRQLNTAALHLAHSWASF